MMRCFFKGKHLRKAVGFLQKVLDHNHDKIMIEFEEGQSRVMLRAGNKESKSNITIRPTGSIVWRDNYSFQVNSKSLKDIVKSVNTVVFEITDDGLLVESVVGNEIRSIIAQQAVGNEVPTIILSSESIDSTIHQGRINGLRPALNYVYRFAAKSHGVRPILEGVHLNVDCLEASDGYYMAQKSIAIDNNPIPDVVINLSVVRALRSIMYKNDEVFWEHTSGYDHEGNKVNWLSFFGKVDDMTWELKTRCKRGRFPDLNLIFTVAEDSATNHFGFDVSEFKDALFGFDEKAVAYLTMAVVPDDRIVEFREGDQTNGVKIYKSDIGFLHEGLAIDLSRFRDIVRAVESINIDCLRLRFGDKQSPMIFERCDDPIQKEHIVIMPVNMNA